jgi:hypothetical protein
MAERFSWPGIEAERSLIQIQDLPRGFAEKWAMYEVKPAPQPDKPKNFRGKK